MTSAGASSVASERAGKPRLVSGSPDVPITRTFSSMTSTASRKVGRSCGGGAGVPSATAAQISEVTTAFRALKDKIPGILSFEQGKNHSPEKLDQGFTNVYLLTFDRVESRDAYLPHPEHKKFGELLDRLGVVESVFVVDFTAEP